jgi:hypothetical protein
MRKWRTAAVAVAAACVPLAVWATARRAHDVDSRAEAPVRIVGLTGATVVAEDGVEHALRTSISESIKADDEVHTGADATARASLTTGAVVDIGPSSRLHFHRAGERHGPSGDRVELSEGKIDVRVPKLADGEEVSVHTGGVTVVVHGTKFTVEHRASQPGTPAATRVSVLEGRVAVYAEGEPLLLSAGEVWDSAPGASSERASPAVSDRPAAASPAEPSSTLAIENALLREAMNLRRSRQYGRAVALLDELLAGYPGSPLAETARVERLRALRAMGDSGRLHIEAERYLKDYPAGHARAEVSHLLDATRAHRP